MRVPESLEEYLVESDILDVEDGKECLCENSLVVSEWDLGI